MCVCAVVKLCLWGHACSCRALFWEPIILVLPFCVGVSVYRIAYRVTSETEKAHTLN